jgi:transposase
MQRDNNSKRKGYTAKSYLQILQDRLLPTYNGWRHFQQDNAQIHRAQEVDAWLLSHAISVMEWPPHSPDLNPIEHVWAALKRLLHKLHPNVNSLKNNKADKARLAAWVGEAWNAIPQSFIDKLMDSVPRRATACKKARGFYTKY